MRFLFVDSVQVCWKNSIATALLSEDQCRRLQSVLRLKTGDRIFVRVLPEGKLYEGTIETLKKRHSTLSLLPASEEILSHDRTCFVPTGSRSVKIHLAPSIIRKKHIELVVQKASELGVHSLTPLAAEHCDVHLVKSWEKDSRRLLDVTLEACMQCQRPVPLYIHPVVTPAQYVEQALKNHHRVFVLHESAAPADTLTISRFGQLFQTDAVHEQQGNGNEGNVSVLIGPEGGFSGDEVFSMAKAGARIFKLPGYILRAETASILAASLFGVLTAP